MSLYYSSPLIEIQYLEEQPCTSIEPTLAECEVHNLKPIVTLKTSPFIRNAQYVTT